MDFDVLAPCYMLVWDAARDRLPQGEQNVADPAPERDPKDPPGLRRKSLFAKGAIGGERIPFQIRFGLERDQSFGMYQTREHADRECAAAESEHPDAVALCPAVFFLPPVVVAQELVEIEHIALHPHAEREADDPQKRNARRSYPVAEHGDLFSVTQIEGLIKAPYIGLERLGCAIAGSVRKNDQISGCPCHGRYPLARALIQLY